MSHIFKTISSYSGRDADQNDLQSVELVSGLLELGDTSQREKSIYRGRIAQRVEDAVSYPCFQATVMEKESQWGWMLIGRVQRGRTASHASIATEF